MQVAATDIDQVFAHTTNLASCNLNSKILACSNDYFASADNLLTPTPSISRPASSFTPVPDPYDWVVIKLGVAAAYIHGVEVDTAHFTGNYGEKAELQATHAPEGSGVTDAQIADPSFAGWKTLLPVSPCGPSQRHGWKFDDEISQTPYTHFRLLMYPDGGFARLRLYGHAIPPPAPAVQAPSAPVEELSSALNGGVTLGASDEHYTPSSNILLPGRGKDMGDGWETARSRAAGHVDWAIVKLGLPGSVSKVVVDTKDFRGNFPRAVRVHGLVAGTAGNGVPSVDDTNWVEIVKGDKRCQADTEHVFGPDDLTAGGEDTRVFSHVKLTLVPDGGVKRFRIFGRRA
ncbi:Allantoicase [Penicillium expansum]|nr:Allantoicase [Penicillium expansum]